MHLARTGTAISSSVPALVCSQQSGRFGRSIPVVGSVVPTWTPGRILKDIVQSYCGYVGRVCLKRLKRTCQHVRLRAWSASVLVGANSMGDGALSVSIPRAFSERGSEKRLVRRYLFYIQRLPRRQSVRTPSQQTHYGQAKCLFTCRT